MSFEDGWAAINLEMPEIVPRTEYSAEGHLGLVSAVSGIEVTLESSPELREEARQVFVEKWNYSFFWSTMAGGQEFGKAATHMGHAVYAEGGTDFDENISSPYREPEDVLAFDPWEVLGKRDGAELTRRFEESYRSNCERNPGGVNMTGIYITCMSGLIDLFGWDLLLLAAGVDPEAFGEVTNRYASWIQQYFDALGNADLPVVMVHDDIVWTSGAFLHPDWYRKYIFPNLKRYLRPLRESGKKILFTSDGDYTEFIDDVAGTGVDGFVMEPMTDMKYIAQKYGKTHSFVGNADTRILLSGSREEIRAEVERCMDIGRNCPGFFMAVGNHIPANTPVENALYYNEVYEELGQR